MTCTSPRPLWARNDGLAPTCYTALSPASKRPFIVTRSGFLRLLFPRGACSFSSSSCSGQFCAACRCLSGGHRQAVPLHLLLSGSVPPFSNSVISPGWAPCGVACYWCIVYGQRCLLTLLGRDHSATFCFPGCLACFPLLFRCSPVHELSN